MKVALNQRAVEVLEARYLLRDLSQGQIIETPEELFERVANSVSEAEKKVGGKKQKDFWFSRFLESLVELEFLPNSPTLMNAGTQMSQLSACFVIPIEDNLGQIFDSLKLAALVQQSGGGTGFSFSRLRRKGDPVSLSTGVASGPVSFMRIFDTATENIRQGGKRRGANMGILRVDHPDIEEFVQAKLNPNSFVNFNLSVGVTNKFMKAVLEGGEIALVDPWNGKVCGKRDAGVLLKLIASCAWNSGDPGMIFLDQINRTQPTPDLGEIEATNPCGEVPLLPFEACNLGSINLTKILKQTKKEWEINWEKLSELVALGVRFLDDVIDVSEWPSPLIERQVKGNRKIGLGVMGFAEMLILLGIPYDSPKAVMIAERLMKFISDKAWETSSALAKERGVFPNWKKSRFANQKRKVRNATVTSIAPTGTISMIAGTSSGIEPLFGLSYTQKNILGGKSFRVLNPIFEKIVKDQGGVSERELQKVQKTGKLPGSDLFRTALDISPSAHLDIQEAFQKHTDNAVSKTINLAETASPEDILNIYLEAWKRRLKGITVFRYGCRKEQVFELGQSCHSTDCRL
ncbi:MAG: adenosylcobalamin-dependent ribonucleoside-diphosphate reductase [Proteobacteria bacterium]|nr:adenosylcobalamin-dependent ribonucleoside-diphosphate reductase [Pseudomonadota bacterium]